MARHDMGCCSPPSTDLPGWSCEIYNTTKQSKGPAGPGMGEANYLER